MFRKHPQWRIETNIEHDGTWTANVREWSWGFYWKDYMTVHYIAGEDTRQDAIDQAQMWIDSEMRKRNSKVTTYIDE